MLVGRYAVYVNVAENVESRSKEQGHEEGVKFFISFKVKSLTNSFCMSFP